VLIRVDRLAYKDERRGVVVVSHPLPPTLPLPWGFLRHWVDVVFVNTLHLVYIPAHPCNRAPSLPTAHQV
jgi:hypothetical protein